MYSRGMDGKKLDLGVLCSPFTWPTLETAEVSQNSKAGYLVDQKGFIWVGG